MKRVVRKLYMVKDDGDEQWKLCDNNIKYYKNKRSPKESDITAEALADMMDENAGDCNAHDFAGVHRGLAQILAQELGREATTRVLRRLVNYSGLYGMMGVCGEGDVSVSELELECSLRGFTEWNLSKRSLTI